MKVNDHYNNGKQPRGKRILVSDVFVTQTQAALPCVCQAGPQVIYGVMRGVSTEGEKSTARRVLGLCVAGSVKYCIQHGVIQDGKLADPVKP
jgi:hypothetical protein